MLLGTDWYLAFQVNTWCKGVAYVQRRFCTNCAFHPICIYITDSPNVILVVTIILSVLAVFVFLLVIVVIHYKVWNVIDTYYVSASIIVFMQQKEKRQKKELQRQKEELEEIINALSGVEPVFDGITPFFMELGKNFL